MQGCRFDFDVFIFRDGFDFNNRDFFDFLDFLGAQAMPLSTSTRRTDEARLGLAEVWIKSRQPASLVGVGTPLPPLKNLMVRATSPRVDCRHVLIAALRDLVDVNRAKRRTREDDTG